LLKLLDDMKNEVTILDIDKNLTNPNDFFFFRDRYDYGPFPPLYFLHYCVEDRATKYYGAKISYQLNTSLGYLFNGRSRYIVGLKNEWDEFVNSIFKKTINNPKFVSSTNLEAQKIKDKFEKFLKSKSAIKTLGSTEDIIRLHSQWFNLYAEFSFWNIPLWLTIPEKLTDYLKTILQTKYDVSENEFQLLTTPDKPTYVFKEEIGLLKCALNINFEYLKLEKQEKKVQKTLKHHSENWFWIPFDYLGPDIWGPKECLKRIFEISKNKKGIKNLLESKLKHYEELKAKQKIIIKKYKIPASTVRLLDDLHTITIMQDEKKEICTKAQYFLQKCIFALIGKQLKIDSVVCIKFSHEELWAALRGEKAITNSEVEKRKKSSIGILSTRGYDVVGGEKAEKFYKLFSPDVSIIKEIKGQIACRGIVIGKVKILLSPKEIYKIEKGDILVATMTTPDYIPAMSKAAAIVTSEGGLTCHAAIVSRELKIPCIIGTKIAHIILKDGDLVEVDANNGVVRIIK